MAAHFCADCGGVIAPQSGPRRKYCVSCSPPKRRPNAQPKIAPVEQLPRPERSAVYDATLGQLQAVDRESTPLGTAALTLAEQVDAGGHTATGLAALVKQLEATLRSALEGTKVSKSAVDELRERRERRRGA